MKFLRFLFLSGCVAAVHLTSQAALELASPFSDHAVLQREVAVPVWGWDEQAGATVTVSFAGQTKETRVNRSGVWRVDLDPLPASATGGELVVRGSSTITLKDVVVGEVWLISGQSNMEWTMKDTRGFTEEIARPANPLIRHLYVKHEGSDLPALKVGTDGWKVAAPDTLGGFSGVGYFFARMLAEKLQVPVGLLHSSVGGSPIEAWIPEGVLRSTRAWAGLYPKWQEALKTFPQRYADQPGLEAAWAKASEDSKRGIPNTMKWPAPPLGPGSVFRHAGLFNGMITPLAPYALRGALWYQGESNAGRASEYVELLPAMIGAWRAAWPQGDFPFFVVQLPNFTNNDKANEPGWAYLREAQVSALRVPAVGVAVNIDADEPTNLHPTNKRPVGERLARLALQQVFKTPDVTGSGPVMRTVVREGAAMRVSFSEADGLTSAKPEIPGFQLAGEDRVFRPAQAKLDGVSVVVSSPDVPEPVAVRYAFTNAPEVSLVNSAGLPAAPFRTDDW